MTNPRQRSRPGLRPKFSRIALLLLRRKVAKALDWYATADPNGFVSIHPGRAK